MKIFKKISIIIFLVITVLISAIAQPIPIEIMMGNKYGVVDLAFSKKLSPNSRLSFFHLSSVEFDYNEEYKNSFILQELILFETVKNLNIAGGLAYNKGGLSPTAGVQYIFVNEKFMVLLAPRINIGSEPSYDMMNIFQYKIAISKKVKLYTRAKFLNVFDEGGNIKSYQWFRLGLDTKGIQFGLAFNLDEFGPNPSVETNYGLFISKEIF